MKNIFIIIVALCVAAGGFIFYQFKKAPVTPVSNQTVSLPTTNQIVVPKLVSVTPSTGPAGTSFIIRGERLLDIKSNQNIAIVDDKGVKGYLVPGDIIRRPDNTFTFAATVDSTVCTTAYVDTRSCTGSHIRLVPGKYTIHIEHSSTRGIAQSNRLYFTVTK